VGLFGRSGPNEPAKGSTHKDRFVLKAGEDGKIHDHCWFCGGELTADMRDPASTVAVVAIEPLGEGVAPLHGVCHADCATRAKGSLSNDGFGF
jgi:hypothetical protein